MALSDAQEYAVVLWGENPAPILLIGAVNKGDILGYSNGWLQARADTGNVIQARCVAAEDGVVGQYIVAYFGTTIIDGNRFTGGTTGAAVYVSDVTPGMYTETAPTDAGDANKIVGYLLDATRAAISPNVYADSVAPEES